jgi:hypothetical protein
MKKIALFSFAAIIGTFLLFSSACKKDKNDDQPAITTGKVLGKVMAPNGTTAIPMANVFVDVAGEIYFTHTSSSGEFTLDVPAGAQTLYIETGNGNIFRTVMNIDVPADGQLNIPVGTLKLQQTANLAYIAGAYDNIQDILINQLGYTADELTVADLDNLPLLQSYSGLFLNCGKSGILDANKYANLLSYVNGGGSIYASDWAVEYLTGDGYVKSSPSHVNSGLPKTTCTPEVGGFIEDSLLCTDKIGPGMTITGASILPSDLQAYMGVSTIDVVYDLGAWEQILDLDTPPWEVLISDPTYGPLAIRMTFEGTGSKNGSKQEWVTICHIPPGNPSNAHTITIAASALPAHLAHGDMIGSCEGNGGTVYYTTFHNHAQGTISPDMYKMLEYFILNL